ncbi:hypothetical protein E1742_14905 [Pseudoduganella plicata]|uniref:Uncharacterized protein n=1 Tax=Pseudoduganella plicata TaxID=321984 RepID=A0ABX5SCM3_9BURK|nr:hypothetical protein E1742_14905 [Pseudoduganella plicata]
MDLIEAVRAEPGIVWIGEQHPLAIDGHVATQRDAVAAQPHRRPLRRRHRCCETHAALRIACRGQDLVREDLARCMDCFLRDEEIYVVNADRLHPWCAATGGRQCVAVLAQILVVAGNVAMQQRPRVRTGGSIAGTQLLHVEVGLEEKIAVFIAQVERMLVQVIDGNAVFAIFADGRTGIAAKVARSLAAHGQQGIGQHADIVFGIRVRKAEADAAKIVSPDVDDAMRRAHQLGTAPRTRCDAAVPAARQQGAANKRNQYVPHGPLPMNQRSSSQAAAWRRLTVRKGAAEVSESTAPRGGARNGATNARDVGAALLPLLAHYLSVRTIRV